METEKMGWKARDGGDACLRWQKSQRERGTVGQEVRGQRVQRGLGQWACGYGVRWVCGPRAECQAEKHLGGLTVGPMRGHGMEGGVPDGKGGESH
ncbi:hypothetical protein EYF80_001729 [Liparis tanakae]|uniref:Uncharacterized protein n=1 Tax=Liparis tanakae TaxID=230148 RepID=A0A4Z2JEU7_9TELE|nr:hypothetical protein EYF80_001729 [Liparis tanakae]